MNKKIDYIEIIKQSAKLVWKKKILAVFGLFVVLGSLGSGFGYSDESDEQEMEVVRNFIAENMEFVIFMAVAVLIFLIVLVFLRAVGISALTKFASGALYEDKTNFKMLFKLGKKYVLKIVAIDILFAISILILIATLSVPIVFLFTAKAYVTAGIIGFVALIIIIPVLFWLHFVKKFAYVFLIISDLKIKDSIEKAYDTFKENIWHSFLFSIIVACLGFLIIFVSILAIIPSVLIFALPSAIAFIISDSVGYVILGIGILIFATLFIAVQSFFEAFRQVSWVIFVKELIGIKKEEKEEAQKVILLEQSPKTENL